MTLEWLFHSYQRSLLKALFKSPVEAVHINELARRAGVDSGNTKRYLEKFAECGIVTLSKRGRTIEALPALENPETRKIFELFELEKTRTFLDGNGDIGKHLSGAATCLMNTLPDVRMVSIKSDESVILDPADIIHLAVVVGSGYDSATLLKDVQEAMAKCDCGLPVDLDVRSTSDIEDAWERGGLQARSLWENRIVLYGEGYFWKIAARRGEPIADDVFMEELVQHA